MGILMVFASDSKIPTPETAGLDHCGNFYILTLKLLTLWKRKDRLSKFYKKSAIEIKKIIRNK